ncbi:hypothetical protein PIB30_035765 [Stylosanthes scabra]|uniref:Uncharacterized protein n=1 Tax=Stylosanthes scabra TaxID=79078 RepID=A0ABU6SE71_9FABA|nr:hypothetical protein [Stylosanthes scabra]
MGDLSKSTLKYVDYWGAVGCDGINKWWKCVGKVKSHTFQNIATVKEVASSRSLENMMRGIYASSPAATREVVGFNGAIYQRYPTWETGVDAWNAYHGHEPDAAADHDGNNAGEVGNEETAHAGNEIGLGVEEPAEEAVNREAEVARASSSSHSRGGTDTEVNGPGGDVGELPRVMGAIEALEGRVSQLEVDKWELLLQLAETVQQMAMLMAPKEPMK